MRTALFLVLAVAGAFGCGCGSAASMPPPSIWPKAVGVAEPVDAKPESKPEGIRAGSIAISDEIARICIIRNHIGSAPRFAFDSDDIGDPERHILGLVARCFTTGPLRGRAMRLTGRTDPRGEDEYNMSLGDARATTVKGYLHSRGVDVRNISATSRGELDASGDDEGGWAHDRRVDIDLVK